MKRIITLTGSFNPVTKAHYKILCDAIEKFQADEGVFIETNDKYLRKKSLLKVKPATSFILSEETRAKMLQSLHQENSKISFGGKELGGESPNTYKSLISLLKKKQKQYPGEEIELFYLFGADKIKGIPKWYDPEGMIKISEFLVYSRNLDVETLINNSDFLSKHRNRIHLLTVDDEDVEDVSSTEVRRRFFAGKDYSDLMNAGPYYIMRQLSPQDFPPVTDEDLVRANMDYGGRFGKGTARKLIYKINTRLFKEWKEPFLGDKDKHRAARAYTKPFTVSVNPLSTPTKFGCFNLDCVDVAKDLIDEGLNPAILNLASRVSPGGGYHDGTRAQEESLCYSSTLSQSLYQFGDSTKKHIRDSGVTIVSGVYPMDLNYGGVYSPCVTFFRNNEQKYYSLKDEPFDCPVISVASLSNRDSNNYTDDETQFFDENGYLTEEGKEIESNKIRTIYRIALDNHHDSLILGAFGCGVYKLKCDEVAQLFWDILQEDEFKNRFKKIVFAIYEGIPSPHKGPMGENGRFAPFYNITKK